MGADEAGVELRHMVPRGARIEVSEEGVLVGAGMARVGAEVEVTHGRMPASGVRSGSRDGGDQLLGLRV